MIKFRIIDETRPNKEYSLPLNFKTDSEWYDWVDDHADEYDSFVNDLEERYGIHDFDGKPGVVGYSSYEIREEDYPIVMREWFDFWNKHDKVIVRKYYKPA